jgi:hypothetical protein
MTGVRTPLQEIKIMYDLMVAALQTKLTRVVSYRQPVESLLQSLGVDISGHNMSHYGTGSHLPISQLREEKQSELLAYLISKLKATKNSEGTSLFDQTTLTYGSNIRTSHSLKNCPVLVAGNKSLFKHGAHYALDDGTPLCNLWLTILNANGLNQQSFGNSNGLVEQLLV